MKHYKIIENLVKQGLRISEALFLHSIEKNNFWKAITAEQKLCLEKLESENRKVFTNSAVNVDVFEEVFTENRNLYSNTSRLYLSNAYIYDYWRDTQLLTY